MSSLENLETFVAECLVRALDGRLRATFQGEGADRIRRIEMRLSEETSKGLTLVLPFYSRLAAYEMTGKPFDAFMPDLFDGLPALGTDR